MCPDKRSPCSPGMLIRLACLAGLLGFTVPGCSGGGGDASPEARARVKEIFKKRFENSGDKTDRKTSR
jgi:hypothetical protein